METYMVNIGGVQVKTTVTNRASLVDSSITELILSCDYSKSGPLIIGLDVECDRDESKAVTLQLTSSSRCLIIQLTKIEAIPQSLINFLTAPLFCFVGDCMLEKLSMLRRDYGLECRNTMEMGPFLNVGILTGAITVVPRPFSVLMGDWGAANLSMEQIETAASNGFFSIKYGKQFTWLKCWEVLFCGMFPAEMVFDVVVFFLLFLCTAG